MFSKIMVPVDLRHEKELGRALQCAADLTRMNAAEICYVGATTATPNSLSHTPAEYEKRLEAFAKSQSDTSGHSATHHMVIAHDPTTDIDDVLLKAVDEVGADLVVMATHVPGMVDYAWPSNGGKIAAHSNASVFLVRS